MEGTGWRCHLDITLCSLITRAHAFLNQRFFTKFESVRRLCKRGPDGGASVFVGLPSQAGVLTALKAAGLQWPTAGVNGSA